MQHNQAAKKKYTNPKSLMALSSDQSSITNEEQESSVNLEFENFHPLTPHIFMISLPQYPEPVPFISIPIHPRTLIWDTQTQRRNNSFQAPPSPPYRQYPSRNTMGYIPVRAGDLHHLMQLPVYMGTSENWEPKPPPPPPQTLPLSEALPYFQYLGQQVNFSFTLTQHNLKTHLFLSCKLWWIPELYFTSKYVVL